VKNGLKVIKLYDGKLKRNTNIREGFVITAVNNREVTTINSFIEAVKKQQGGIMLEGKYAGDSTYYYYAFGM
jgi:S1-C subfamily serine protease